MAAKSTESVLEGMQFDRGYLSPYFVTDPERMEPVLEDPLVLLHEKKISSMKDLLPLLEPACRSWPAPWRSPCAGLPATQVSRAPSWSIR